MGGDIGEQYRVIDETKDGKFVKGVVRQKSPMPIDLPPGTKVQVSLAAFDMETWAFLGRKVRLYTVEQLKNTDPHCWHRECVEVSEELKVDLRIPHLRTSMYIGDQDPTAEDIEELKRKEADSVQYHVGKGRPSEYLP